MNAEQEKALVTANKALKDAWPKENLQISLNLAKNHSNVNFNIKQSGIINPERAPNGK
jgi:hypothetical protein